MVQEAKPPLVTAGGVGMSHENTLEYERAVGSSCFSGEGSWGKKSVSLEHFPPSDFQEVPPRRCQK